MLFWVQIASKGHVDMLFPAFYKLIVSLFTLYWTCLFLLFTDTKYYPTNQVHPVISRLCDPIEGTDAAHLAECLGKYNKYNTVDSRYLEFDGTMEKIRVHRSSTQEELWKYRKCSLFNDERETTRAKFWRAKTSIACLDSRNDLKIIRCFFSVKFFESCETTDNF